MRVENNFKHKINFTALRLKKGSEKYISSMQKKALFYVDSVGEYLKNTKYYHVDIDRDVYISSVWGDKYYYPHNIQQSDKFIFLRARGGLEQLTKKICFENVNEAKKAAEFISQSETPLVRAGRIAKFLDEQQIKTSKEPKGEIHLSDTHEEIVRKLMSKYGG